MELKFPLLESEQGLATHFQRIGDERGKWHLNERQFQWHHALWGDSLKRACHLMVPPSPQICNCSLILRKHQEIVKAEGDFTDHPLGIFRNSKVMKNKEKPRNCCRPKKVMTTRCNMISWIRSWNRKKISGRWWNPNKSCSLVNSTLPRLRLNPPKCAVVA